MRKLFLIALVLGAFPVLADSNVFSACSTLKVREACLENPNCNWDDSAGKCVDIQFVFCDESPTGLCPVQPGAWRASH